jgi:hypothetical protein
LITSAGSQYVFAQGKNDPSIPGTIFFQDQTYLHFDDINYIHGYIAATSRRNRYKSFKIIYQNSIRVMTIYSLKFLKVNSYKPGKGQDGEEVLNNVVLRVETKGRQVFEMPYFELGWVQVELEDPETKEPVDRRIPFFENNSLKIEKIIFD